MNRIGIQNLCLAAMIGLACCIASHPADGSTLILRVDAQTGTPTGPGDAWGNRAYDDLQPALDRAEMAIAGNRAANVEIWVADGTYVPSVSLLPDDPIEPERFATYLIDFNNVQLYGGFAGNETTRSQRDPSMNVSILSGDIGVIGDPADNVAHVVRIISDDSVVVNGFTIQDGTAITSQDEGFNFGGGIRSSGEAKLMRLIVKNCQAGIGGGVSVETSGGSAITEVINCEFRGNTGLIAGGGISIASTNVRLMNCLATNNTVTSNLGSVGGAGIAIYAGDIEISNCTIADNFADSVGGIYSQTAFPVAVRNCIVWGNTDSDAGTGVLAEQSFGLADVEFSCFEDDDPNDLSIPFGGLANNNIDDDPDFVDATGGNYRLGPASRSIDTGSNAGRQADRADVDEDGNTLELVDVDLDFNDRLFETLSLTVDMGPYEAGYILGDVNCDGAVNTLDISPFTQLLSSGEYSVKGDANKDGQINLLDVQPFVDLITGS